MLSNQPNPFSGSSRPRSPIGRLFGARNHGLNLQRRDKGGRVTFPFLFQHKEGDEAPNHKNHHHHHYDHNGVIRRGGWAGGGRKTDGGPGHGPVSLGGTQLPFKIPSGTYSGSTSVTVLGFIHAHLYVTAAIRTFNVKTLQATTDIHISGVANITANGTIMTIVREPGPNGGHKVTLSGSAWSSQIASKLSDSNVEWNPNSNSIYLSGEVMGNTASFTLTN